MKKGSKSKREYFTTYIVTLESGKEIEVKKNPQGDFLASTGGNKP